MTGAVCATLGVGALVFGTIESADSGWSSSRVVGAPVIGLALLAALVVNEFRVEQPIMPLRLFASRERSGAYAARMLYLGAMIGFFTSPPSSCRTASASPRSRPASGSSRCRW